MNFSPFGNPFPGSIPGIHQFAASGALSSSAASVQDTANRYHSTNVNMPHFNQTHAPILSKFRSDDTLNSNMNKYNGHTNQYSTPYTQQSEDNKRSITTYPQSSATTTTTAQTTSQPPEISQDLCNAILQQQNDAKRVLQNVNTGWQSLTTTGSAVADYLSHLPANTLPLSLHHFLKYSAESIKKEAQNPLTTIDMSHAQNTSQSLNLNSLSAGLISSANILNQPQLCQQPPQNQHQQNQQHQQQQQQQHQQQRETNSLQQQQQQQQQSQNLTTNGINTNTGTANPVTTVSKKKKKKKPPKEKKPRPKPGEIRLTTALDGSTLFCCPECQMAYPERGLLEQHLVGHNLERRFICDICNAALKRKDHLTRHKQSHNPERPFVCTICLKAFKRKEQLTLHFVIHSGEKRHICNECGKGFYRKDHLRKHTRSHIARRVKAELSQQNQTPTTVQNVPQQPSQPQVQNQVQQHQQLQHSQQMQQIQHHNSHNISQLNQHQSPPQQHQSMMA